MTQSTIAVHDLSIEDLDVISDFFVEDLSLIGKPADKTEQLQLLKLVLQDKGEHCRCWVAKYPEGEILGVILVNLIFSMKFAGRSLWIDELFVSSQQRRKGIGRILVQHTLTWAQEKGFRGIDLEAYQNNIPAAVLYRSLGFQRLGRERFGIDLTP